MCSYFSTLCRPSLGGEFGVPSSLAEIQRFLLSQLVKSEEGKSLGESQRHSTLLSGAPVLETNCCGRGKGEL